MHCAHVLCTWGQLRQPPPTNHLHAASGTPLCKREQPSASTQLLPGFRQPEAGPQPAASCSFTTSAAAAGSSEEHRLRQQQHHQHHLYRQPGVRTAVRSDLSMQDLLVAEPAVQEELLAMQRWGFESGMNMPSCRSFCFCLPSIGARRGQRTAVSACCQSSLPKYVGCMHVFQPDHPQSYAWLGAPTGRLPCSAPLQCSEINLSLRQQQPR